MENIPKENKISTDTILALKSGNHAAFETIFLTYFDKIYYFINSLIKSSEEAKELSQNVFEKIWNIKESIDESKSFSSFLYTIARNTAFNYLKHKLVKESYYERLSKEEEFDDPLEVIFAKEIALLIEMSVEKMSERRKKIYNYSRHQGLTNEEIAIKLNISKKTVENHLSLILSELRKIISAFILLF